MNRDEWRKVNPQSPEFLHPVSLAPLHGDMGALLPRDHHQRSGVCGVTEVHF